MPKIRLLLVDSSEIFREGLANLLQSKSNIDVVSVPSTVSQAVKAARAHKPNVVLTDVDFSEASGIELMLRIEEVVPDARIIVFTHSTKTADFFSAVKAGATGYISKDSSFESLVKTITLAAEGKLIIDLPTAKIVVAALRSLNNHKHEAKTERIALLTEQERRVIALMAQDRSNKEIAEALFTSENTVKVHVHSIMQKLSARNRLEATACAIEEGLQYSVDESRVEPM